MVRLASEVFFCVVTLMMMMMMMLCFATSNSCSWCPPARRHQELRFQQKTSKFWEFEEESNRWVEVGLPFDLLSCINGSCTKVGSIQSRGKQENQYSSPRREVDRKTAVEETHELELPLRKRISLTLMSESSLWVTGQSGSIYERFWNGVQWVIAPHELPVSAGHAVSVFFTNRTILALSEAGTLYQLELNDNSQPIWTELALMSKIRTDTGKSETSSTVRIKTGFVSHDGERLYVSTTSKSLLELTGVQPLRWEDHGRPPGGDVMAVVDSGTIRPGVVFTVSSTGGLYEFDKKSKPSWKKHIWSEALSEDASLLPLPSCTLQGLFGAHSVSLFLLTKDGFLIERSLHKRKWKWRVHGAPQGHRLSAITAAQQNEPNEKISSLFLTTTTGFLFEYQLPISSGRTEGGQVQGIWVNHMHPQHAKIARGIRGVQLQIGRMIFALDDGRLAELHLPGIGGESPGPNQLISFKRKASNQYEWSVLEVPETEGWNAEYCSEGRGPSNCILGIKDMLLDDGPSDTTTLTARRRRMQEHPTYILTNDDTAGTETSNLLTKNIKINFRMRVMHMDRSFFLITDHGMTYEFLYADNVWLWLSHEHSTEIMGALGSYNGSLFLVDSHGSLLMRERSGNELTWINCTAMKKGRRVETGAPWDDVPGKVRRVTAEDALFFVNKEGRLLQFTVALRNFKWKDCRHPSDTKVAYIIDQEVLRMHIVFVVGRNGRIYQYNKLTDLWHKHYQSPHLVLSITTGTAVRPSLASLAGSLFLISENGGLVEYHWSSLDGWQWVEHGTPSKDVVLVGAPGPCFDGTQLFVIGSDGQVYRRHQDHKAWKWTGHGHPRTEVAAQEPLADAKENQQCGANDDTTEFENEARQTTNTFNSNCDDKVAPVRPMLFSADAVIFELEDGRLAELRRPNAAAEWDWVRIIGTPTSPCWTNYWTAVAS